MSNIWALYKSNMTESINTQNVSIKSQGIKHTTHLAVLTGCYFRVLYNSDWFLTKLEIVSAKYTQDLIAVVIKFQETSAEVL